MPWDSSNPLYRWKMKQAYIAKEGRVPVTEKEIRARPRKRRKLRKINKDVSTIDRSQVKPMVRRRRRIRRAARRYSPRRYARRFRRGKAPMPILPILGGVVAPMVDSFNRAGGLSQLQSDPVKFGSGFIDQIGQHYMGVSIFPELSGVTYLNTAYLFNTYGGLLAGIAGHMLATKFGVNRYIKKVPLVGKWVQL